MGRWQGKSQDGREAEEENCSSFNYSTIEVNARMDGNVCWNVFLAIPNCIHKSVVPERGRVAE